MSNILIVGIGGAIGAVARYSVDLLVARQFGSNILGTFTVNITGSLLLGFLAGLLGTHPTWPIETRLFIAIGILGSFTTFSTLSLATVDLMVKGEILTAMINVVASVLIGVAAAALGMAAGRAF